VDYIPADDAIVLSRDSQQVTVRLRTSTVGEAEASSSVRATVANADEVLHKMKFEAHVGPHRRRAKKRPSWRMRQQATAEFAKMGLPQGEIDGFADKMGDAVVAGLQADAMRQDFARAFTEVYTKDELPRHGGLLRYRRGQSLGGKTTRGSAEADASDDAARHAGNAGRAENRRRLPPPAHGGRSSGPDQQLGAQTLCALCELL